MPDPVADAGAFLAMSIMEEDALVLEVGGVIRLLDACTFSEVTDVFGMRLPTLLLLSDPSGRPMVDMPGLLPSGRYHGLQSEWAIHGALQADENDLVRVDNLSTIHYFEDVLTHGNVGFVPVRVSSNGPLTTNAAYWCAVVLLPVEASTPGLSYTFEWVDPYGSGVRNEVAMFAVGLVDGLLSECKKLQHPKTLAYPLPFALCPTEGVPRMNSNAHNGNSSLALAHDFGRLRVLNPLMPLREIWDKWLILEERNLVR